MKNFYLAALLLLLIPFSAAGGDENAGASSNPASPSSEGATVSIVSPLDGDIVTSPFLVKFMVSGMGIAPAGSNIDNTGHHHLLIDVVELPPMDQPLPATDQILHFGGGQTETQLTLPPGEHSLQLVFADYAHRPHNPPVISEKIVITVAADAMAEPDGDDSGQ